MGKEITEKARGIPKERKKKRKWKFREPVLDLAQKRDQGRRAAKEVV